MGLSIRPPCRPIQKAVSSYSPAELYREGSMYEYITGDVSEPLPSHAQGVLSTFSM